MDLNLTSEEQSFRDELRALTPSTYTGYSERLVDELLG